MVVAPRPEFDGEWRTGVCEQEGIFGTNQEAEGEVEEGQGGGEGERRDVFVILVFSPGGGRQACTQDHHLPGEKQG